MTKRMSRTQLMARLGATQRNHVWSWCGVASSTRRVYFSLWMDKVVREGRDYVYTVQEPHWGILPHGMRTPARKDHDDKLSMVFDHGYQAFGYLIEAVDPRTEDRKIKCIETSYVIHLELSKRADGTVVGRSLGLESVT